MYRVIITLTNGNSIISADELSTPQKAREALDLMLSSIEGLSAMSGGLTWAGYQVVKTHIQV